MTQTIEFNPVPFISKELQLPGSSVEAVVKLLNDGNTVPFIARYRKEATGSLDEIQIRAIEERATYLEELEKRRQAILSSIEEQGKLTDELKAKILQCQVKSTLEDLYLPYKKKRRTRATVAKEKGLEPLALRIASQPKDGDPIAEAAQFIDDEKGVEDAEAALAGARDIVADMAASTADVRAVVREAFAHDGVLVSKVVDKKKEEGKKFKDYFDYREPIASMPSHRFLAVRRGEREGVLKTGVSVNGERLIENILDLMGFNENSPFCGQMRDAIEDGYKRLISTSVESDIRIDLKLLADRDAVNVFARNLRALLLAAPLGGKPVIGVDPGLRTGCKCAAVDATGTFCGNMTFNIVQGDRAAKAGREELLGFVKKNAPVAIAVGNGTGGRETEKFVVESLKSVGDTKTMVVQVSEAGASVYSASELAGKEFPQLDLTVRGAISIARRLQDPLAELVKIEPRAIGVGQYQHDVHQPLLGKKLEEVVESCVNGVGVDLNTTSAPLLARVAGIGPKIAQNIIEFRKDNGEFRSRRQLLKVKKLGRKAFEQAAGFLRIRSGENPLDASAVHPERYELVEEIAVDMGVELSTLVGDEELSDRIDIKRYVGDTVGEPTLRDIVDELKKPGRDPRDEFEPPAFRDDINALEDLQQGMELEGVVTNVTNFGAFVDVGVHRDGLVHISQLADRFVKDPNDIVKVGDKIKVRVMEVDLERGRISFTAKTGAPPQQSSGRPREDRRPTDTQGPDKGKEKKAQFSHNPFANLLKK